MLSITSKEVFFKREVFSLVFPPSNWLKCAVMAGSQAAILDYEVKVMS